MSIPETSYLIPSDEPNSHGFCEDTGSISKDMASESWSVSESNPGIKIKLFATHTPPH